MLRPLPLLILGLLSLSACTTLEDRADPADRRAVLDTVQDFFDFLATRDAELGERALVPEGVFVTVRNREGRQLVGSSNNAESIERIRASSTTLREAFVEEPKVLIDGDVAVVWGRYTFEVDGSTSHTGVDAFNLVRTAEGWKISGGAYSVVRPPEP